MLTSPSLSRSCTRRSTSTTSSTSSRSRKRPSFRRSSPAGLVNAEPPPALEAFMPPPPSGVGRLLPGSKAKYEAAVEEAKAAYELSHKGHAEREAERERMLAEVRATYEREVAGVTERAAVEHREIDEFRQRFAAAD